MTRPGWDSYFLGIAEAVADRADCSRRRFGAVLVKERRIVATGYNGAPAGDPGCLSGACPRGRMTETEVPPGSSYDTGLGSCIAVHAEANALLYGDRGDVRGSTLYLWGSHGEYPPCEGCRRLLRAAGVSGWYGQSGTHSSLALLM